jgi:RNA polymerase sigma factor (sigma-70 family)
VTREYQIEPNQLIERCLKGDRTAQYALYRKYEKAMYNTAWRIVRDDLEAEDVLQEAFISAFQHLATFQGTSTFGAWLKRIVVNKSLTVLQKRRLPMEQLEEEMEEVSEDVVIQVDEGDLKEVMRAIEELPDGYRVILSLYLLEGYDHVEISEILGISVGTSKSQYNRAKKKLRELLNLSHYER